MNNVITIRKESVEKHEGVVVLPVKKYKELIARVVPTFYLKGKKAEKLDKLVKEGLREYKAGKTKRLKSLADLA
ncbi:hypothetical protein A2755_02430 [Candidatus Wolfebacteria bacterium RIFCSPHIGHO2_01_FULL_48_22]|uniref:Uncharacterized protein n=2 Tax=Candidatus Wolfeibacteriota TaxID=1752735 RepID=A0A1F8DS58_9BACT|nr:MAG: hypothetical protein A2755_02430 [Candidatus Wolfebacteria bacterium RIFCSPHIGHO2_01_FULL_48_22]OGM92265.1 MAG: hypothetical protein A2935_00640 [Candidatus Wolfebacteria bacterium RIFCSPLOWO2_01_FULL_47_17b]